MTGPPVLVLMGVSGSGKSTLARPLAQRLGWPFQDCDDLHPAANIAKMTAGTPLTDADRAPWLAAIAAWIDARVRAAQGGVVTCSALKRAYRAQLTDGPPAGADRLSRGNREPLIAPRVAGRTAPAPFHATQPAGQPVRRSRGTRRRRANLDRCSTSISRPPPRWKRSCGLWGALRLVRAQPIDRLFQGLTRGVEVANGIRSPSTTTATFLRPTATIRTGRSARKRQSVLPATAARACTTLPASSWREAAHTASQEPRSDQCDRLPPPRRGASSPSPRHRPIALARRRTQDRAAGYRRPAIRTPPTGQPPRPSQARRG